MTWTHHLVAGLAAMTLAASAGCSGGRPERGAPPPRTATPTTLPADPAIDYSDPQQVCAAFAGAVHRVDTSTDAGPEDGYRRAVAYVDARLGAAITNRAATPRNAEWQEWVHHRAYVIAELAAYTGDALTPDSDGEKRRAVLVIATPIGRDGWHGTPQRRTIFCSLRPVDVGWRITDYGTG